jgi:hypothetical protein
MSASIQVNSLLDFKIKIREMQGKMKGNNPLVIE